MSLRPVLLFTILLVCCVFCSVKGQHNGHIFDDGPDDRCITPNRKPGRCTPIEKCSTLYMAFNKNRATEPRIKKYLERATCNYRNRNAVVCCETDAGACTTPEDKIGACVPLDRCDPVVNFLSKKPFFSEDKIKYIRSSQCTYDKAWDRGDFPRVCCPIFTHNITGQINNRFIGETSTQSQGSTSKATTPQQTTSKITTTSTKKPVVPRVALPTPGEDAGQCGAETIHDRIIGGNKSDLFDYPWMALLKMGNGEWACGGSLIHPRYVLTAAHCVTGPKVIAYKNVSSVRLGEWDIDSEIDCVFREEGYEDCAEMPMDFEVEDVIPHSGFAVNHLQNDIALIRLKTEAPWTDTIRPVCLPTTHKDISGGNFSVAGWGATENDRQSNFKLYLNGLPLYDRDRCIEKYNKANIILTPGQICVGGLEGKDSCTGDSGGPLMLHEKVQGLGAIKYQVGIVSFGPQPCGLHDRPAVYTLVEHYMDWIYENMRP